MQYANIAIPQSLNKSHITVGTQNYLLAQKTGSIMLRNYIIIAFKVLHRRKFFTFISLFGISFTLLVLMVVTALLDNVLAPGTPEINMDRSLYVQRIELHKKHSMTAGSVGYYFLNRYTKPLKIPEMVTIHSRQFEHFTYINNQKLKLAVKLTDGEFWQVHEFRFISGFPFDTQMVENANRVVVINQRAAKAYFGNQEAVGQFIEIDEYRYRVIGVVGDVGFVQRSVYADVWIPITAAKQKFENKDLYGHFQATILAYDRGDFIKIKTEFKQAVQKAESEHLDQCDTIICNVQTQAEILANQLFRSRERTSGARLYVVIIILMLIFISLPVINLVNMNISRILERASEIGVRKAFGAKRITLVGQFITENIILTLLGGIIGLALAAVVLNEISRSTIFLQSDFSLNYRVFALSLTICLFFGFLSGVLPAYKMSRLHPVQALKGGQ
jgi:putative ABC transport system permease protein